MTLAMHVLPVTSVSDTVKACISGISKKAKLSFITGRINIISYTWPYQYQRHWCIMVHYWPDQHHQLHMTSPISTTLVYHGSLLARSTSSVTHDLTSINDIGVSWFITGRINIMSYTWPYRYQQHWCIMVHYWLDQHHQLHMTLPVSTTWCISWKIKTCLYVYLSSQVTK